MLNNPWSAKTFFDSGSKRASSAIDGDSIAVPVMIASAQDPSSGVMALPQIWLLKLSGSLGKTACLNALPGWSMIVMPIKVPGGICDWIVIANSESNSGTGAPLDITSSERSRTASRYDGMVT
ncbi:hypothetical protein GCM10009304_18000 [Pseudomonas matsuisoli]|uniref:Uncharacterized protein n=1 Tax=Pseudomonas matsuisoli TaxID=1515666 RepID=A0A917UX92_9PSED|nr:hypothetical protein GCM10009304_18000 [Pseudomonas matsuisoli]